MDEKDEEIKRLREEHDRLKARLEELERRLGLTSQTSSKPPSSDGLRKKPAPRSLRSKGQRPSGGQKGHKGHTLDQVREVDYSVFHTVESCHVCQRSLVGVFPLKVIKRQVFDIPAPRLEVT